MFKGPNVPLLISYQYGHPFAMVANNKQRKNLSYTDIVAHFTYVTCSAASPESLEYLGPHTASDYIHLTH